jgi:hypothetical protein
MALLLVYWRLMADYYTRRRDIAQTEAERRSADLR